MANSHHYYIFFFFFATAIAAIVSPAARAETDSSDLAALLDIAKSLTGSSNLRWTDSSDPCSTWSGISCSAGGKVTAIQAGNKNLTGTLSPSIGNLTALTRLELHFNSLSGPLPSALGNLTGLQYLLLHHNKFDSIPKTFFKNTPELISVYLDENPFATWQFNSDDIAIASGLVNFSAINTNLSGEIPAVFATSFPSLNHLALSYNSLSGSIPVEFSGSGIRSLWLNDAGLSGSIDVVGNMSSLVELWLNMNGFTGAIPDLSGLTELEDLQLRDNRLTGPVPDSLTKLPALKKLTLTNNLLQGPVLLFPKSVDVDLVASSERFCLPTPGNCDKRVNLLISAAGGFGYPEKLADSWKGNDPCGGEWVGVSCDVSGNITVVNLQKMGLNGTISPVFAQFPAMQKLLLAGNNLTGMIPKELTGLVSLKEIDVSDNRIYGQVPDFGKSVVVNTQGNPDIGKDSTSAPTGPKNRTSPAGGKSSGTDESDGGGNAALKKSSGSAGVIAGSVVGAACVVLLAGLLGFCLYKKKRQRFRRVQSPNTTVIHPRHSGSDPDMVKITVASSSANGTAASDTYSRMSSSGRRAGDIHMVEAGNMVISIQVLRNVTNNFSEENVLGRGGFGTVYKGELHDGTKIAVKRMESAGAISTKGLNEFKSEIAVLTKVRHRNLVSLLGYCLDGNERLLVYEYMPQGTLSRHLFDWKDEGMKPLEWKKRLSIALDVARGVEYLHTLAQQSFIHRDLKPSNILLGDDMKAKVADFGLVRLAPDGKCSLVETRLAGTFGYLAPEYAVTGRVTTKADIFSFGVILMELITGRKALDESQPEESVHLVTWFRRMQLNKDTFGKAIDPTIDLDEETFASISTVAELAGHCCAREPHQRPDMGHAVNVLSSLAEMWRPADPDSEDSYGIDLDMTLPQALKKWQAFEDSHMDGATSSFLASLDNTQTSIPTRPPGFAESFTSADGR